jgi:cyclopropane-fatty-acyl-phospholipid synthase
MNLIARSGGRIAERAPVPDFLVSAGIRALCGRTQRGLEAMEDGADARFAEDMTALPIAVHADAANIQHYELPPAFFGHCLGTRRKYSCCLYPTGGETLAEAEGHALEETAAHAALADGQAILELGCGWGSLTLWMAEKFPRSHITAVSNSAPQREYIEERIAAEKFRNVRVITADMNTFEIHNQFDRIVSVEMFEHMANWRALLTKARHWLKRDGRMFLHVFTHATAPYRFELGDKDDWIAQHFFTGGIMPSHGLIRQFDDLFAVEDEWRWNGTHYAKTAMDWLALFDHNDGTIEPILHDVYGDDWYMWKRRWRIFFLATAGLFGFGGGDVWGVSHYRLKAT